MFFINPLHSYFRRGDRHHPVNRPAKGSPSFIPRESNLDANRMERSAHQQAIRSVHRVQVNYYPESRIFI